MRYLEGLQTVRAEIPAELVVAAGLDAQNLSVEAARLLALELYREGKVSLERAAELCHTPLSCSWNSLAGTRFRSIMALTIWKRTAERCSGSACDCCFELLSLDCSCSRRIEKLAAGGQIAERSYTNFLSFRIHHMPVI
jgi:hypothetical protein